ncbi:hypothetical protein HMPREF0063_11951 [Aeromicrobium marinum DSM 15272]|uniref:Uncharacterized protein n=1 Tax=Aeromicrobium marinum DSM 15272 TaxID=585531 RepID=E2SE15_9ACTN|nr:hypothetical protein [Aeromicrobium marinum]EFQ82742.1 hypothetical protein HMPREF0063_11951 [Aeromicrobium marinum DSM 15272]
MVDKPLPVSFWQARVLDKAAKRAAGLDWSDALRAAATLPLRERTHDDDVYDLIVDGDLVLVGAHRVLNKDFMTTIDAKSESIRDIMDDVSGEEDGPEFAHTTVMAMLPRHNAIAVVRGGANSPRAKSAAELFLQRHVSVGRGAHWFVEPIMTPPQLDDLRRAKGVQALQARYETLSLLDDPDPQRRGLATTFDNTASSLGAELIIDVNIRIAPGYRHSGSLAGLKDLVLNDLPRLSGKKRSVTAKAVFDDDSNEVIDLVAGKLASSIELEREATESRRYSALLDGLKSVSVDMQTRVDEILRG